MLKIILCYIIFVQHIHSSLFDDLISLSKEWNTIIKEMYDGSEFSLPALENNERTQNIKELMHAKRIIYLEFMSLHALATTGEQLQKLMNLNQLETINRSNIIAEEFEKRENIDSSWFISSITDDDDCSFIDPGNQSPRACNASETRDNCYFLQANTAHSSWEAQRNSKSKSNDNLEKNCATGTAIYTLEETIASAQFQQNTYLSSQHSPHYIDENEKEDLKEANPHNIQQQNNNTKNEKLLKHYAPSPRQQDFDCSQNSQESEIDYFDLNKQCNAQPKKNTSSHEEPNNKQNVQILAKINNDTKLTEKNIAQYLQQTQTDHPQLYSPQHSEIIEPANNMQNNHSSSDQAEQTNLNEEITISNHTANNQKSSDKNSTPYIKPKIQKKESSNNWCC